MSKTVYKYKYSNIKDRIEAFVKDGVDVYFSVTCLHGKSKNKVINKLDSSKIDSIKTHVSYELPDSIILEIFDSKDAESSFWIGKFELDKEQSQEKETVQQTQQFQGFGEVEIQNIVDQRLQEKKRQDDFERLKIAVDDLNAELSEVQDRNAELEDENEQLKVELESKKQIRYYAGMLGDILEGIGISKDKIRSPIASLMGIADEKENKEISQAPVETQTDSSGIVEEEIQEETVEQKHRNEVITLMTDYLKTRDNMTLSNLFNIFSEVEKDPKTAFDILQFLETKKA